MEEISFNGEKYLKASVIADKFGYTSDYVGQLCRGKQVKATLVGRSWYVNEDSVREHKKGRHRSSLAKSKQSVRKVITDKSHNPPAKPRYLNRVAKYEDDSADLFPTVKKERVEGAVQLKQQQAVQKHEDSKYVEKPSHVTSSDKPKNRNREGYHPAVRVVRSTRKVSGEQKDAPIGVKKVAPRGHRKKIIKKQINTDVKFDNTRFTLQKKIFVMGLFLLTITFFIATFFVEKKIQVEVDFSETVSYVISGEILFKINTDFLSTYFKF